MRRRRCGRRATQSSRAGGACRSQCGVRRRERLPVWWRRDEPSARRASVQRRAPGARRVPAWARHRVGSAAIASASALPAWFFVFRAAGCRRNTARRSARPPKAGSREWCCGCLPSESPSPARPSALQSGPGLARPCRRGRARLLVRDRAAWHRTALPMRRASLPLHSRTLGVPPASRRHRPPTAVACECDCAPRRCRTSL